MTAEATLDSEELREMIADVLEVDAESITPEIDFVRDLGVDSLLALELAVTLERHYQVKIESHEIGDVRTISDISALLLGKLRRSAA